VAITVPAFGVRLGESDDFVDLAATVCRALAELFDVPRSAVALHRAGGGPIVLVDNFGAGQDAYRLASVHTTRYRGSALDRALHGDAPEPTRFGELGYVGDFGHALVLPLLDPSGLVGSIQCGRNEPFSLAQRRDLETLATQLSARLAQLGITAITADAPKLTARQHEVARLAARGATTIEIAGELAISTNTVKKILKDIYERLAVHNRPELANELRRVAPRLDGSAGVTRMGSLAVTRGTFGYPDG